MASKEALRVADIINDIMSLTSMTDSVASITLTADGDGTLNFSLTTMDKSEQFVSLEGIEDYLAVIKEVIGNATDKAAANLAVRAARERRRLEKQAAIIVAQLGHLV